jgi:hypothetical protein
MSLSVVKRKFIMVCTSFSECSVCKKPIGDNSVVILFPDLVQLSLSDFGDFYDACAQHHCLQEWSRIDEFVEYYNRQVDSSNLASTWRLVILPSGELSHAIENPPIL